MVEKTEIGMPVAAEDADLTVRRLLSDANNEWFVGKRFNVRKPLQRPENLGNFFQSFDIEMLIAKEDDLIVP